MASPTIDAVLTGNATFAEYFKLSPSIDHDPSRTRESIKAAFLVALRRNPLITEACRAVQVSRNTINQYRHSDPDFNQAIQDTLDAAQADLSEALTHGIVRRAFAELEPGRAGIPTTAYFLQKFLDNRWRDSYSAPVETTARQSLRFMMDSERDAAIDGQYTVAGLPESSTPAE